MQYFLEKNQVRLIRRNTALRTTNDQPRASFSLSMVLYEHATPIAAVATERTCKRTSHQNSIMLSLLLARKMNRPATKSSRSEKVSTCQLRELVKNVGFRVCCVLRAVFGLAFRQKN